MKTLHELALDILGEEITPRNEEFYKDTYAILYTHAVDTLMSIASAIGPSADEELELVQWLSHKLTNLAAQLPKEPPARKDTHGQRKDGSTRLRPNQRG
jgi:hypothetical protein